MGESLKWIRSAAARGDEDAKKYLEDNGIK